MNNIITATSELYLHEEKLSKRKNNISNKTKELGDHRLSQTDISQIL